MVFWGFSVEFGMKIDVCTIGANWISKGSIRIKLSQIVSFLQKEQDLLI